MAYDGFRALREMAEKVDDMHKWSYTVRTLFPVFRPFEYSQTRVLLGWDRAGRPVWLDTRASKIILICGKRGCLPINTEIQTPDGLKQLKDLEKTDTVLSYNFKKNQIEENTALKHDSEVKDMIKITLESGREVICSLDHKWFVKRNSIDLREAKNLKIDDKLVVV